MIIFSITAALSDYDNLKSEVVWCDGVMFASSASNVTCYSIVLHASDNSDNSYAIDASDATEFSGASSASNLW